MFFLSPQFPPPSLANAMHLCAICFLSLFMFRLRTMQCHTITMQNHTIWFISILCSNLPASQLPVQVKTISQPNLSELQRSNINFSEKKYQKYLLLLLGILYFCWNHFFCENHFSAKSVFSQSRDLFCQLNQFSSSVFHKQPLKIHDIFICLQLFTITLFVLFSSFFL